MAKFGQSAGARIGGFGGAIPKKLEDRWEFEQVVWIAYTTKVVTDPKTLTHSIEMEFDYVNSWRTFSVLDQGMNPDIGYAHVKILGEIDSDAPKDPNGAQGLGSKGTIYQCGRIAQMQGILQNAKWGPIDMSLGRYAIHGKLKLLKDYFRHGQPPRFRTYGEAVTARDSYQIAAGVFKVLLSDAIHPGAPMHVGWPVVERDLYNGKKDLRHIKHPDSRAPFPLGAGRFGSHLAPKGMCNLFK